MAKKTSSKTTLLWRKNFRRLIVKRNILLSSVSLLMLSLVGCSTPSSTLTPLQRRVMEAKELEGSYDDAFKATLAVLQDRQYNVKTSDYQGGIVYAESQMQPAPNPSTLAKLTILYTNKNDFPFRMKTTVTFEKFTDKIIYCKQDQAYF